MMVLEFQIEAKLTHEVGADYGQTFAIWSGKSDVKIVTESIQHVWNLHHQYFYYFYTILYLTLHSLTLPLTWTFVRN